MCDHDENKPRALQALCDILENAVRMEADAIELEYIDDGLEICYVSGNMGLGNVIADRELEHDIIAALVEKANLGRYSRGKMRLDLHGEQHTIIVEEYESFGESAFRLSLPKPGQNPDAEPEPDEVAIDFSIPRRCVYRQFADQPGPCPHCGGTLHQRVQTYLVATHRGTQIMDALFVGNDMGWFCAGCPTVVINTEEMDVAFAHPRPDWDLGDELAVLGIVDLDAIPPGQEHLPLGEIDPLPLISFGVAPGRKSPARSARSTKKKRPKRAKDRRKSKKGKRRRR